MSSTPRIRRALLAWFAAHKRDLPWRGTRDPYVVLLSEVMLQQTRVETVIPYFERFLARFPTIGDLARAELDRVLELWSGLGYYRRARSLWLASREVVARYGGELPRARADLESLPGIGPYSAGAIASIAFGDEEALVDGNVARVLSRLHAIEARVGSRESAERCWSLARELVHGEAPGDLNQALMELGATICTPKQPRCAACPVRDACVALRDGRVDELPRPVERRASPRVFFDALVVSHGERVLLAKRPAVGLFAGLWEPPMVERGGPRGPAAAPAWLEALDARERAGKGSARRVEHVLTHRIFDVRVSRLVAGRTSERLEVEGYVDARFDAPATTTLALSSLARKILAVGADDDDGASRRRRVRRETIPVERSSKTDGDEAPAPARRARVRRPPGPTGAR